MTISSETITSYDFIDIKLKPGTIAKEAFNIVIKEIAIVGLLHQGLHFHNVLWHATKKLIQWI